MTCEEFRAMIRLNPVGCLPSEILAFFNHCTGCQECMKFLDEQADLRASTMTPEQIAKEKAECEAAVPEVIRTILADPELAPMAKLRL